jgi:hypothetical protein
VGLIYESRQRASSLRKHDHSLPAFSVIPGAMLKDHMKDASAFEGVAKNAKDPDVKAFAQQTLPVIKAHLAKIKSIAGGT